MYDYCSFCQHCEHFGKCEECDCPRDHMPPDQWQTWLDRRDTDNFEAILAADIKEAMRKIAHEQALHEVEEIRGWIALGQIPVDSDESWQASEALLKRGEHL